MPPCPAWPLQLSCCPVQERPGGGRPRKLSPEELQAQQQAYGRPADPEEGVQYDRLLSTLLGWVLVLLPSFRPKHVVKCLTSLAYMKLYNAEVGCGDRVGCGSVGGEGERGGVWGYGEVWERGCVWGRCGRATPVTLHHDLSHCITPKVTIAVKDAFEQGTMH